MKIGILTQIFPPTPGGAAVYYDLLSRYLVGHPEIGAITVVTERRPPSSIDFAESHEIVVKRVFPSWYNRRDSPFPSGLLYAWQNLQYLLLPQLLPRDLNILLVHAGLLRHPSSLASVMKMLRARNRDIRLVADVRDPVFNERHFPKLARFDALVCCSENIVELFRGDRRFDGRVHLVPVIFDASPISVRSRASALLRYGLKEGQFILFTNGLVKSKGIALALQMVEALWRRGWRLPLAVVGRAQDKGILSAGLEEKGILRYLGVVPHGEVMALAKGAALHVTVNSVEAMPRGCLEAIAMGTPVLLPRNVPEFFAACQSCVAGSYEAEELADQAAMIIAKRIRCGYDLTRHEPMRVIDTYVEVFRGLL